MVSEPNGILIGMRFLLQKSKNLLRVIQYFDIVDGFRDSQIAMIRLYFTFAEQLPQKSW